MLHRYCLTGNIGTFTRRLSRWALFYQTRFDQGNARLDGLLTQLNLTGNKYNIALVRLFVLV